MLYAVLQGLTSNHLAHLDRAWISLANRIQFSLKQGAKPMPALRQAFQDLTIIERSTIEHALTLYWPIMQIPGLTYRQREALLAVRSAHCASLAQLSRVLAQDRRLVHRRLAALVRKGLVIRFFQPGGVYYMAVRRPQDKTLKRQVTRFIAEFIQSCDRQAVASGFALNYIDETDDSDDSAE